MKPLTAQYSPSRFLGASAATSVAETTIAPDVGRAMTDGGTESPAILVQAWAASDAGSAAWAVAETNVEDRVVASTRAR